MPINFRLSLSTGYVDSSFRLDSSPLVQVDTDDVEGVYIEMVYRKKAFQNALYMFGDEFKTSIMFFHATRRNIPFKRDGPNYLLDLKDVSEQEHDDQCSFLIGFVSFLITLAQINHRF